MIPYLPKKRHLSWKDAQKVKKMDWKWLSPKFLPFFDNNSATANNLVNVKLSSSRMSRPFLYNYFMKQTICVSFLSGRRRDKQVAAHRHGLHTHKKNLVKARRGTVEGRLDYCLTCRPYKGCFILRWSEDATCDMSSYWKACRDVRKRALLLTHTKLQKHTDSYTRVDLRGSSVDGLSSHSFKIVRAVTYTEERTETNKVCWTAPFDAAWQIRQVEKDTHNFWKSKRLAVILKRTLHNIVTVFFGV